MSDRKLHRDSLAIHAGQSPDPSSGAVMQPIVLSSTFVQESPGVHAGWDYSRAGNPTRDALERCLAALEGGDHGLAFSSGCAATTSVIQCLRPGDHVIASDDVYGGSFRLLDKVMTPTMGIEVSWVDLTDLSNLEAALRPSRPSTPLASARSRSASRASSSAASVATISFPVRACATPCASASS